MVNRKSEYRIQFCKYDPDIGKKIWLDNRSVRACRKLTNQETHYWKFQICPEEYECHCTGDEPLPPPNEVSKTRLSLRDKHRAQEVATQVPDPSEDVLDNPRARGPSAPPTRHLKPNVATVDKMMSKTVQTKPKKMDKDKTKVITKPPPSPKRRRSQSQLPVRTSRRVYPQTGVDKWRLNETQRQAIRWVSEYQEQFSKHRDEYFSRSPVIRSRPTSAPPCTGIWSKD